jgi:hypothetical protein
MLDPFPFGQVRIGSSMRGCRQGIAQPFGQRSLSMTSAFLVLPN